ncbi:MAG: hypothetical protein BIFFINMI_03595 [Phycisphaerae bacterium]|nr:hypothetical protein [Phycisphaerae bacterium]
MLTRRYDIVTGPDGPGDGALGREWLLTNGRGSYASSTAAGVNTRKYHGLLVAACGQDGLAAESPGERFVMLSALADDIVVGGESFPLACFEFRGTFHPRGDRLLAAFEHDAAAGVVAFRYRLDDLTLVKSLVLARGADTLAVRYEWEGATPVGARVRVRPFLACRHYHANRLGGGPEAFVLGVADQVVRVADAGRRLPGVTMAAPGGRFDPRPDMWRQFHYRAEAERGEGPWEDLFTPGIFEFGFDSGGAAEWSAAVEPFDLVAFDDAAATQSEHRAELLALAAAGRSTPPDRTLTALILAADNFIAAPGPRASAGEYVPAAEGRAGGFAPRPTSTILAGFPWFADWGRDAFISLPGLLLTTGREAEAHAVLRRFAGAIRNGIVPNRFTDDPGGGPAAIPCDYNSVDASLWFIHAAFAWAAHTGRWDDLHAELLTPILSVLEAYHHGTDYGIHVAADGLLACGDGRTQLTWMDAMVGGQPVTPRAGKCVEVNALYGHALKLTADRLARRGEDDADVYVARYRKWSAAFAHRFVSPRGGLYDVIGLDDAADDRIRPNQVIAVALESTPLPRALRRQVVELAIERLLTPFGLRSLAPGEPGYAGQCSGPGWQRDGAYHQGTVWAWLIGPFLDAYLAVHDNSLDARRQAGQWLAPLIGHMDDAGIGQISEIFDGDAPHRPRGCFAQAWSVAEVLRLASAVGAENLKSEPGRTGRPLHGKTG